MYFSENWALFSKGSKVFWSYGLPEETAGMTAGLATGLDNLGRETATLHESIASIELLDKRRRPPKKQEILIVAHMDYYFVASDPLVTSKLLRQEASMPVELSDIVRSVLVGQAAILYASLWTSVTSESAYTLIDKLYSDALHELGIEQREDLNVGNGTCSFGGLDLPQLLFLHSYVRGRLKEIEPLWNPWGFIINKHGVPIHLTYNFPKADERFIVFLSSIYNFIESVFEACPTSLIFGGQKPLIVKLFLGERNILAACNLGGLLNDTKFIEKYKNLKDSLKMDLEQGLQDWLISQLADINRRELEQNKLPHLLRLFQEKSTSPKATPSVSLLL
ncbi:MAG: hypothetical protein ACFFDI_10250 [Promethearchaeota archaeon]